MTGALPLLCTSGAVLWVALAASAGLAPPVWRVRLFWAAVMLGVPGVGLLTYCWGPGPGMLAFLLGLLVLIRLPDAVGGRRRRGGTARGAPSSD